jgi:hypothetical protein
MHTGACGSFPRHPAVRGNPQAGGADGSHRLHTMLLGFVDHALDRNHHALQRGGGDHAFLPETFAQAGDLGAVDDGAPLAARSSRSPMWNLMELVPASMTAKL